MFRVAPATFELGLSSVEAAPGEWVRVYDAARTVVDLMRLRHRLGEVVAHTAVNRAVSRGVARPADCSATPLNWVCSDPSASPSTS